MLYRIVLLVSQLGYLRQLWSPDAERLLAAANVAPYYVLNNIFVLAFTQLWIHAKFWGAEVIDIANLLSQGTLYWKYPGLPTSIHLPAVAGPYAWTISALFWTGSIAVPGGDNFPKRVVANIFIWVFFFVGQGHIVHRSDHHFGYAISLLSLCKCTFKCREIRYSPLTLRRSSCCEATISQSNLPAMDIRLHHFQHFPRFLRQQHHDEVLQP